MKEIAKILKVLIKKVKTIKRRQVALNHNFRNKKQND